MIWDIASFDLALLCTSLSAALLACVLLALEFFGSQRLARQAPGVIAAVLALAAIGAWAVGGLTLLALGCMALAGILLVAWPVSFEGARHWLTRLVTPKAAWTAVLAVSMIASRYLAAHMLGGLDQQSAPPSVDLEDLPVKYALAYTDLGRVISLFRFKIHSSAAEIQQFIDSHEKDRSQIIRLFEPNSASNCHGWVFTGGRYGIRDPEIAAILVDNGYAEVTDPHEGDLAIYADGQRITHSGLVRMADKHAPVLIESKWGPLGVYLHTIEMQPFSGTCKFYRGSRSDHLIVLRQSDPAVETVSLRSSSQAGAQ